MSVLQGLMHQAEKNGDASAQLAGGLVVRVSKALDGWRITLERVRVAPAAHEVAAVTSAATALGWSVHGSGSEESGMLQRKWIRVTR